MASSRQRLASFADVSAPVHWNTSQYIAEYMIGSFTAARRGAHRHRQRLIWTQCSTCSQCVKRTCPTITRPSRTLSIQCHATTPCARPTRSTPQSAARTAAALSAFYGAGDARGAWPRPLSLVSQTGAKKFSYCHTPYLRSNATAGASSHLFVGTSASLSCGSPVKSMSFVQGPKDYPFYYVPLVGISVGQTRLSIPPTVFALKENGTSGGVIVDWQPHYGTGPRAYGPLTKELRRQLNGASCRPLIVDGAVCVAKEKTVPSMVFHFSGGADMVLPPENYWVPLDDSTSCMVMETINGMSIIGNFQLQNMHLLYDLAKDELSFQIADCSSL
ncbi:hypothetical protein ZWY2020_008633 [Hordeum vulgare]|nr:hypothetical protein ZWY2020_008633 [Hordeum vulgare]